MNRGKAVEKDWLLLIISMFFAMNVLLSACGGGGGGGGGGGTSLIISGTAAAGAPIVGIVNVKGANGSTASSTIEIDGSYSIDVTALKSPYVLFAEGSVNGKSISIYSAAVAAGTINITPITDFILRNAMGEEPDTIFDNWKTSQVDAGALSATETDVQTQLAPVLSALGVSSTVDLLATPFDADQTGLDAVLDSISITYSGDIATVENNLTGSSYTDDITLSGDGTGFPSSDETDTQAVLGDAVDIDAFWHSLEDLYSSQPTSSEIIAWFNNNVADDYLGSGEGKTEMQDQWITDDSGPQVGVVLSATIIEPFDVGDTVYTKGYQIRVYFSYGSNQGNFADIMVYDGTEWLWYGDRRWLEVDCEAFSSVDIDISNQMEFYTGYDIIIDDETNYAYNQGVRSAIVTGPTLPVDGVVYEHSFPETDFDRYSPSGSMGSDIVITDDAIINSIPNNAEYTFSLCSESAEDLYDNIATCTVLQTYTATLIYPPLLNSELNASLFATLTNPTTHDSSELNFGGQITINWTLPEGTQPDHAELSWWNSSGYDLEYDLEADSTSVTFDTIGLPAPAGWGQIEIEVRDIYGRDLDMTWELF